MQSKGEDRVALSRRTFLIGGIAGSLHSFAAVADEMQYPSRRVRIVAPFAPGGSVDIYARLIGRHLTERLGQEFYVENRPGAGTMIGMSAVAKAPSDGYTLVLMSTATAIGASLYKNLDFVLARDILPVAQMLRIPLAILVHHSAPFRTSAELINYARANPGQITFGTAGVGSTGHICAEKLRVETGAEMVHVPYRGDAQALVDVLSGRVQVYLGTLTAAIEHVRSRSLRPLAMTSASRHGMFPEIPALSETIPNFEVTVWFGICAPQHTPGEIVTILNRQINASLSESELHNRISELGGIITTGTPDQFREFLLSEIEKWRRVVEVANISIR